ncbi:MAG: hypothetical protein ACOC2N_03015 [Spirochaetota bacterium]
MISPFAAILATAVCFYLLIPGIGAFGVRQRWRRFRRRIIAASLLPPVTYAAVRLSADENRGETHEAADARFLGTLESIQGEDIAWIRNREITIAVDMRHSDIYMVSQSDTDRRESPPMKTTWSRIGSLPEGVKVFVSGRLDTAEPHPTIRPIGGEPVLVVFYDGAESTLVRHCIWSGRQLNEYWNSVTPGALTGGVFALTVLTYFLLRQPLSIGYARLAIALAAGPILPLLPPGIGLFYLYRRVWRRGRILRAHRDVLMVPLRYFGDGETCATLPSGELYCRRDSPIRSLEESIAQGLTLLEAPLDAMKPSRVDGSRCTVFGHPGANGLVQPVDSLAEWIAVRGDPEMASNSCQRRARYFELLSALILAGGLAMNFLLLIIALVLLI